MNLLYFIPTISSNVESFLPERTEAYSVRLFFIILSPFQVIKFVVDKRHQGARIRLRMDSCSIDFIASSFASCSAFNCSTRASLNSNNRFFGNPQRISFNDNSPLNKPKKSLIRTENCRTKSLYWRDVGLSKKPGRLE